MTSGRVQDFRVELLTVLQDLSQMKARLGYRATTSVNNHRGKIVFGSISDIDTTEYFWRLAGTAEFAYRSTSSDPAHASILVRLGSRREVVQNRYR